MWSLLDDKQEKGDEDHAIVNNFRLPADAGCASVLVPPFGQLFKHSGGADAGVGELYLAEGDGGDLAAGGGNFVTGEFDCERFSIASETL